MSYIRASSEGQYVDIPCGSNYYIYDNGDTISGWSYGEFAALIGQVADEIDISDEEGVAIKAGFRAHFEGWEPEYRGSIAPPERGEIFCQCVDSRIESLQLTDDLHEAVREWVDAHDAVRTCDYCDERLRPKICNDGTPYCCYDDVCQEKHKADLYDVSVETLREARSKETFDEEWDYLAEHSEKICDQKG